MSGFEPGCRVVCVSRGNHPDWMKFDIGGEYTVAAVYPPMPNLPEWGLDIEEIELGDCLEMRGGRIIAIDIGWNARHFRPVHRTKTDLSIEAFSTIKPGYEEPKRVERVKKGVGV